MIYLQRFLKLFYLIPWVLLKLILSVLSFFVGMVCDIFVIPFVYYILTGKWDYWTENDPITYFALGYIWIREPDCDNFLIKKFKKKHNG